MLAAAGSAKMGGDADRLACCRRRPRSCSPSGSATRSSGSRSSATSRRRPRTKRIVSTSALPAGLSPAEIDVVVKERMAAGDDLYRLDRGAFADLDPTLVVTQDLCAVCAVDVTEVDDALAYLGCRAEVLTLDPMTLDEVLDSVIDGRRGDGHVRPRRGDRRSLPGEAGRDRRRRRRCAAPADARARVDRSRVHRRPLGARPGDCGRRRGRCSEDRARSRSAWTGRRWPVVVLRL